MKVILGDIAIIKTGYSLRVSVDKIDTGNFEVIQAKGIINNNFSDLPKISLNKPQLYLLQKNDILLSTKGLFRAMLFNKNAKTITTSSVTVIRLNSENIIPEYLTAYLNSAYGQKQLRQLAKGSGILAIPTSNLKALQIPIPDLKIQQQLSEINQITNRQVDLLEQKISLLKRQCGQLTNQIIKEIR